ncbi:MAG: CoA-binding protein [Candidatus Tectomicrobia bacterium]|uniref:CoA-binding protein n=1 Tax=Tectimicrobiota bacterium TaxID=2528274 RepID=A0A932I2A8_UNCTE|nr:CoA-binding protein [Candidatus Tectomicrobia bacterium]
MSILLDGSTRVLVQGATGGEARRLIPTMTAYGTRIVAGVSPGKGGERVEGIPIYSTVADALKEHEADLSVLFIPARFAKAAALEAIEAGVPSVHILAEGVPHHDAAEILARAGRAGALVIGPNSQGMVSPGKAKVGGTGGEVPHLMFRPGPVGVVSRSGGMGAEICLFLTKAGIGQSTYVAIGGDLLIGAAFAEMLALFEKDPETKCVVLFGEPGTGREEEAAAFIRSGGFTKPLVAMIPGEFMERMPQPPAVSHTGALVERGVGAPSAKKRLLRGAGARVAERFSEIVPLVREALGEG